MIVRSPTLYTLVFTLVGPLSAASVDYMREVKPVLTQHCTRCHGESKQEGGAAARYGGISRGWRNQRILLRPGEKRAKPDCPGVDGRARRHPADAVQKTGARRCADWVDQIMDRSGAPAACPPTRQPGKYTHWSFVAPERVAAPAVKRADWPRTPIDHFILARLEEEKIAPAPEADRGTLLRRLNLDLVGPAAHAG